MLCWKKVNIKLNSWQHSPYEHLTKTLTKALKCAYIGKHQLNKITIERILH